MDLISLALLFKPNITHLVDSITPQVQEVIIVPQKEQIAPPQLYNDYSLIAHADTSLVSWYGPGFDGNETASGEIFNQYDYTVAHKSLPFGTYVTFTLNGRSVTARVNDRGPYVGDRKFDLSLGAAEAIGLDALGVASVEVSY